MPIMETLEALPEEPPPPPQWAGGTTDVSKSTPTNISPNDHDNGSIILQAAIKTNRKPFGLCRFGACHASSFLVFLLCHHTALWAW